jgi:outer membrane receptor for ferrienterochelin and colicins
MKFWSAFTFYLLLTAGVSYGQCRLSGRILNGSEPLEFAVIGIDGTQLASTCNAEGCFIFPSVPHGRHQLRVSMTGFRQHVQTIDVKDDSMSVSINMFSLNNNLNEVVITGTMQEISRSDSPIPVEILTPKLFQKNPTPGLFEALQMVNGVQPQLNCNVCNTGDIHINGMEGPYTMITIDGMPIVSSLSTVYGLSGIPNGLVQRVEVVKGPASTLYGSEAVGGLVNVITKDPLTAPRLSADVMVTSDEELNADLGFRLERNRLSSLTGINYFVFQNRMDRNEDNFTDLTLQNRISIFNKWRVARKENRVSTLAARFVYEDRWGGEMQWEGKYRGGDSIYGESIFTTRYELIGMYELPAKEKFYLQYSFNAHTQNSYYGQLPFMAQQNIGFAQLYWTKDVSEKLNLLAGLPLRYTYYDDGTAGTSTIEGVNAPQQTFLPGLFLQSEYKLKKLSTLAGIRYDYNSDHGNILSPRLSFKYKANAANTIRLSMGNGYRVVNLFTEDHAALSGSRDVVIREDLEPEKSWNANLNYQGTVGGKRALMFEGSIFYTYFSNKIVGDFITDPQKIIFDNLDGYAISRGISANFDLLFSSGLKVIAGATLMDVYSMERDTTGDLQRQTQLHAPPFSANFSISYTFGKSGLTIDYTGNVKSPMALPVVPNDFRPAESPWFTIQNLQLSRKFPKGLEIYLGVKNLFDFIPKDPILRPFDPFDKYIDTDNPNGYTFDPSYNYSSLQGRRYFLGIRYNLAAQ